MGNLGTGDAVKIGKVLRKQVGVETKNGYKLTMQMDDHKKILFNMRPSSLE